MAVPITFRSMKISPVDLTIIPGVSSLQCSWLVPQIIGGYPILNYVVDYKLNGSETWIEATGSPVELLTITILGLTTGLLYDIRVAAVTAVAIGLYSIKQGIPI